VYALSVEMWGLHCGVRKSDGEKVSVFKYERKGKSSAQNELADNFFKRVKTLRHPHTINYLDGVSSESEICVVTESVVTLEEFIKGMRNSESKEKIEMSIGWGMHCILQALTFVHESAKLVHGFITPESILVTRGGDWKLGGMFIIDHADAIGPGQLLRNNPMLMAAKYRSPERLQSKWGMMSDKNGDAFGTDIWSLGCVLFEAFNGPANDASEFLNVRQLPNQVQKVYKEMLSNTPMGRPSASKIHKSAGVQYLCRGNLFKCLTFLDEYQLKTDAERVPFLQGLTTQIDTFPSGTCCYKILPILRDGFKLVAPGGQPQAGGAKPQLSPITAMILDPFLKIGSKIDDPEEYKRIVVPTTIELFASNDRATRAALLQRLSDFVVHLDEKTLNSRVFSSIASGFSDTTPLLRELTVKSVVVLAPKLNSSNLNEVLLRHIVKLLKDVEPAIRTNTLICLNMIIEHLNEETRKKVILGSFPQAIRDPFVPARIAGLRGIASSLKYLEGDAPALANKVVPSLSMATVDPSPEVRAQAFQCINVAISRLKNMSDEQAVRQKKEEEESKRKELEMRQGKDIVTRRNSEDQQAPANTHSRTPSGGSGYLSAAAGMFSKSWGSGNKAGEEQEVNATPQPDPSAPPQHPAQVPRSGMNIRAQKPANNDGWGDDGGWGDDSTTADLLDMNDGNGWGDDDDLGLDIQPTIRKPSRPAGLSLAQKMPGNDEDFFGSSLSSGGKTAGKSAGLSSGGAAAASRGSSASQRKAEAERKRAEARARMAQRREAKKPVAKKVVSKASNDDWDNW